MITIARLFKVRFTRVWLRWFLLSAVLPAVALNPSYARADVASDYQPAASFSLPSASALFDVLPDGRLIALVGTTVHRETASGSRTFVSLGTLPSADIPSFGAAFVRVSPNGQRIAVGNNGGASFNNYQVGIFTIAGLAGTWFSSGHFDGKWIDDRYLALSAGSFGSPSIVTALDTASANPALPTNPTLIVNIGGASGGIAFDLAGNLFAANGFQGPGPSGTGAVHAVTRSSWMAALAGGPPVDFETDGIPIVDLLSGSPLGFDGAGNLLVGGGDSFSSSPDDNYFAIVHAGAIASALAGGGLINGADPTKVRKLDPDSAAGSFYYVDANPTRHELYAVNAGSDLVFVYAFSAPAVPASSTTGLVGLAALMLVVGARRLRVVS